MHRSTLTAYRAFRALADATPDTAPLPVGVKFYAALGNHDAREQRFYKLRD